MLLWLRNEALIEVNRTLQVGFVAKNLPSEIRFNEVRKQIQGYKIISRMVLHVKYASVKRS